MRLTKRELILRFHHLLKLMGEDPGSHLAGGWQIDHNAVYGGYLIVHVDADGGEHHPFGNRRLSRRQMYDNINFSIEVLTHQKRKK